MTSGSWIHDDLGAHFKKCSQCRDVGPEYVRTQQSVELRRTVPDATLEAMCLVGRSIYKAYLGWLAEPDE